MMDWTRLNESRSQNFVSPLKIVSPAVLEIGRALKFVLQARNSSPSEIGPASHIAQCLNHRHAATSVGRSLPVRLLPTGRRAAQFLSRTAGLGGCACVGGPMAPSAPGLCSPTCSTTYRRTTRSIGPWTEKLLDGLLLLDDLHSCFYEFLVALRQRPLAPGPRPWPPPHATATPSKNILCELQSDMPKLQSSVGKLQLLSLCSQIKVLLKFIINQSPLLWIEQVRH
jgi:hypothetical protein